MKTKIFCDIAELDLIKKNKKKKIIRGFTTNPSLMRKAGAKDYKFYSNQILKICKNKPISFEVFADDHASMIAQGIKINNWAKNVYVKVPVVNSKNKFSGKVIKELNSQKIKYDIASRKIDKNYISYDSINQNLNNYDLIINTTPIGTFPATKDKPKLNYSRISKNHFCYDLIYNPEKTSFLVECEKMGAKIMNGLRMLKSQAEESWRIWNSFS